MTGKVHLADDHHTFTACGIRRHDGVAVSGDRDDVTCTRCLGGAFASIEKSNRKAPR